jgi:glycogen operon protein
VTCHDGFTLNDLVSYNLKHNEANHESNTDGGNANLSWNCGIEGPTVDADIERLRMQQTRNLLVLTLLSVGTPMLLMGDEVRRTQQGNNNAYCQDNEASWFDWSLCVANADLLRFVRLLIRTHLHFDQGTEGGRITLGDYLSKARIEWHGVQIGKPDWGEHSHSLALSLHNFVATQVRYIAINAFWKPLKFELPPVSGGQNGGWFRILATSLPSPDDIVEEASGFHLDGATYHVNPRSIVMLHYDLATADQTTTVERPKV